LNAKIESVLNEIIGKLKENYDPLKVILFGSYAYGEPTDDSDIDLFIVKNTDKRRSDRFVDVKRVLYNSNIRVPISPLVYTKEELEERVRIGDDFILEILQKGVVLYEKAISWRMDWKGRGDFKAAKILFKKVENFDVVLFHLQQAVEKYIKGFLVYNGWKLKRIHDLEVLIQDAIVFDQLFREYLDFGRKLTSFYFEGRYPPGPTCSYSKKEVKILLHKSEEFIKMIETHLKI